ncbi:hypothetical protein MIU77_14430 [Mycolicibacillus parakoreensis]|uniref:PPE-PPW subfamily C-terminal domain-containing protein n=2 Tax=Mycolicibacillus parakoreensis TaxID=1069221 RepID=A0ABY3U729_9MYCO|nr:hypothetical protein MIU77_14430 [Mycolicibacillus parakoreensis]
MTLDQELDGPPAVGASETGAGPLGFAGTAAQTGAARAGGLTAVADDEAGDELGAAPTPMMPSTWESPPQ